MWQIDDSWRDSLINVLFPFIDVISTPQFQFSKEGKAVNTDGLKRARLFVREFIEEDESAVNEEREVRVRLCFVVILHLGSALQFLIDGAEPELRQVSEDFMHRSVDGTEIEPVRAEGQKVTEGIDDRQCVFGLFVLWDFLFEEVFEEFGWLKEGSFFAINDDLLSKGERHCCRKHFSQSFFYGMCIRKLFNILQIIHGFSIIFNLLTNITCSIEKGCWYTIL